ncbi:uncharacterized protein DUF4129 [Glaciihabitans tibetensis]|uniref:Uncharacterized protein DUF4129 n=1 Tax=Glaciihabitans tibetensis TaxID=1266600 RepID=A0A2T0VFG9_9MICO|nr:DUF4129 domain-containing protein [Glaciihabitans tibetensis]PRY68941.1 uncharacterized protein DUF4129 [Glaciihabitans tibetensis]
MILSAAGRVVVEVPVEPDAAEARDWLLRELADPQYDAAKPTWFDRLSGAIVDWFTSLSFSGVGGPPLLGFVLVLVLVVAGIVVAFLVFGLPRLRRRSAAAGTLFGEADVRSAEQLRAAAEARAAEGDYSAAIAEMFRAIARGLAERTIVTTTPGTTAHDFAARAGSVFAELSDALGSAATAFDEVRYLGRTGTLAGYTTVAELERALHSRSPAALPDPESVPA